MGKIAFAFFRRIKTAFKVKRMLLTYVQILMLAVMIPICILGIWFFSNVYQTMDENVKTINRLNVKNMSTRLNNVLEDIDKLAYKMENAAFFCPAPFERDPLMSVATFKMYHNVNRYLDNISILYPSTNKVLTTTGTTERDMYLTGVPERERLLEEILSCTEPGFFNTVEYRENYSSGRLLYVHPLPGQSQTPSHFAVFAMSYETIYQIINTSHGNDAEERQAIIDRDGKLLWANLPFSGRDVGNAEWLGENLDGGNAEFYAVQPLGYQLKFVYCAQHDGNLTILRSTLRYFILCCVLILLMGTALILIGVRTNYRPIGRLVRNIREQAEKTDQPENEIETISRALTVAQRVSDALKSSLDTNISDLRSLFVINAIRGRFNDEESLRNVCTNLKIDLHSNYYFCCCILADRKSGGAEETDETIAGIIRRISARLHGYFYQCLGLAMTVGILCCNSSSGEEQRQVMQVIRKEFATGGMGGVTLSFGTAYADFSQIGRSYLEARNALDYRLIKGTGTVISVDEINPSQTGDPYHPQLVETFAANLRSLDYDQISRNLEHIMDCIQNGNYSLYQTKCICYDLIHTFLSEVNRINARESVNLYRMFNVFSISEFDNIGQLIGSLKLLSKSILDFLRSNEAEPVRNEAEQYIGYLRTNLSNNQFLIETMAKHFGVSVHQMRKNFKEYTGQSVIEYFNGMKVEYAKRRLRETDDEIAAIVQQIGYSDISSFIRKFRTETGMTPGKYRNNYKNT